MRVLALCGLLVACARPRPEVPPAPPSPRPDAAPLVAPDPRAAILAAATARTDPERAAPTHVPALDEVARAAAASAAEGWVVSSDAVRAAMAEHLGSGLDPYVLTARDGAAAHQLVQAIAELRGAAGVAAVGVAAAEGATGPVLAVVALPPPTQPVAIARDGAVAHIAVAWPWPEAPRAFDVSGADSRRLAASAGPREVELVVDCARTPVTTIELDAGDALVASVVNVCAPTPALVMPPGADVGPPARTAVEIEQRLFELINRERTAAGHVAIAWDVGAQAFARRHASRMEALGFVGHVAPGGEDLAARVRQAALPARETWENVGHADGPGRAHLAFMASPGHRKNLLAERARRGGVGVVASTREPGWFYVTEVFFDPR